MKVYVVTQGCYSDYGIKAIFSTMELAEKYCQNNPNQDLNDIAEWDLDADQNVIERAYWDARVGLERSSFYPKYGEIMVTGPHYEQGRENERSNVSIWHGTAIAHSYESEEHAHKLAVEAFQKHLAETST